MLILQPDGWAEMAAQSRHGATFARTTRQQSRRRRCQEPRFGVENGESSCQLPQNSEIEGVFRDGDNPILDQRAAHKHVERKVTRDISIGPAKTSR